MRKGTKAGMRIARDVAAIELAHGATNAAAARVAGVTREAVRIWSTKDSERVEEQKAALLREARARMAQALPNAIENLARVAASEDRDRVPAAKELLARVMGATEADENIVNGRVQQRINEVEVSIAQFLEKFPEVRSEFLQWLERQRT